MVGPMVLRGTVTKNGVMDKTATVTVWRWVVHKRTGKRLQLSKKYLTHDADNMLKVEDEVQIINCPPISARKRFTLKEITHSPELQRESIRKGRPYDEALSSLNAYRQGLESTRQNAAFQKKMEEMKRAREERIAEEMKRAEKKKVQRKKVPYNLTAAGSSTSKGNSPQIG